MGAEARATRPPPRLAAGGPKAASAVLTVASAPQGRPGPGRDQRASPSTTSTRTRARPRPATAPAPSVWPPVTDRRRPRDRRRRDVLQARHHGSAKTAPPGHLRRPPALHLRRRQEAGRSQRQRLLRVRRPVVRAAKRTAKRPATSRGRSGRMAILPLREFRRPPVARLRMLEREPEGRADGQIAYRAPSADIPGEEYRHPSKRRAGVAKAKTASAKAPSTLQACRSFRRCTGVRRAEREPVTPLGECREAAKCNLSICAP